MTEDKGILIRNIYYMLTYAFRILKQNNFDNIAAERFNRIENLFAAILARGISAQLKQGLRREYVSKAQTLSMLRGKLDVPGTIRERMQRRQQLSCEFDEFSENNLYNQILKTTASLLIRSREVDAVYRKALRQLLPFFANVDSVEPSAIRWNLLRYDRNSRTYEMLMNICYFILEDLIQTTESGDYRMAAFSDEHMARLYENFILEYYRQEHPQLTVCAERIDWALDEGADLSMIRFLPHMKTDITLRCPSTHHTLIIDAKYYSHTMQTHFDHTSIHSANLYQIFAYVKNRAAASSDTISGLLLYAKTQESITPDFCFPMSGNRIGAKTLDLNSDFRQIKLQLDAIAREYLNLPF